MNVKRQRAHGGDLWEASRRYGVPPASILDFSANINFFLCNPNNPTGSLIPEGDLREILDACEERGIWAVLDESFLDFAPEGRGGSLVTLAAGSRHLLVIYSLTKFFAIPGLRLGCAVGGPDLLRFLEERQPPWSVNALAQVAGIAALGDEEYICATQEAISGERAFLYDMLGRIPGISVYPSSANFLLIKISAPGWDSPRLAEALGPRGILVRDCSSFGFLGDRFIRVAVRSRPENLRLLEALRELLDP